MLVSLVLPCNMKLKYLTVTPRVAQLPGRKRKLLPGNTRVAAPQDAILQIASLQLAHLRHLSEAPVATHITHTPPHMSCAFDAMSRH